MQMFAEQDNLELCKDILEKVKKLKPRIVKTHNLPTYYDHPILIAAKKGHEEICRLLIDNSGEKNPSDIFGMTIFHFAAKKGLTDVCKLIIKNIDNKNPAALNGCTPLHLAAEEGHLEIIKLIVETGVDKKSLFIGKTPLDLAGPLRSYTFYKLLSKNRTQLCGSIFNSLMCLFGLYFLFFSFLFICVCTIVLIVFANLDGDGDVWSKNNFLSIVGKFAQGTFVSYVITVLLTFIISLKIGFTRKTLGFYR
jgi:hypothetical protein